jgi:hypothetical protein
MIYNNTRQLDHMPNGHQLLSHLGPITAKIGPANHEKRWVGHNLKVGAAPNDRVFHITETIVFVYSM